MMESPPSHSPDPHAADVDELLAEGKVAEALQAATAVVDGSRRIVSHNPVRVNDLADALEARADVFLQFDAMAERIARLASE